MNDPSRFSLGSATVATSPRDRTPSRIGRRIVIFLALAIILGVGGLFFASARFTQALQFENAPVSFFEGIRLVGESLFASVDDIHGYHEGRINVLLLGRAGERHPGKDLTDTVMVLSIDIAKRRIALLSLPRDLLAPLGDTGAQAKLNTLYQSGLSRGEGASIVRSSVTTITGLPIHYFATIDFDGFKQVIDALGGIQIDVKRDIYDTRYPGPNYSYETFELKKGWQKLDGETALKYARMRHNDPEGDFGRAKRQQQILQAVRDKVWSLPTFLNPLTLVRLLDSLGGSVATDITPEVARGFLSLVDELDTKSITTAVVDAWKKESLLRVTHVEGAAGRAFALVPRSGDWDEIRSFARDIFEFRSLEERRAAIEKEDVTILIAVASGHAALAQELAADIRETFPVRDVLVRTFPDLEKNGPNAIIENTGNRALYTLDSLIGRYDLERREESPRMLPTTLPAHDLIILYSRDTIPGLIHEIPPEDMGDFAQSYE